MKNTLAENMLRFGIKNLKESEVNKLQSLSEQSEQDPSMVSAGLVLGDMQLTIGAPPVSLKTTEGAKIVFNMTDNFNGADAAGSDDCVIYRHSNTQYIAMGMIGILDTNSRTINSPGFKAILFRAIPATSANSFGAVADKVSINAKTPYFVIGKVVKAVEPELGRMAATYLTKKTEGKALLSGIINMYKMLGQMTDFDINNSQRLLSLANSAGKIAAA